MQRVDESLDAGRLKLVVAESITALDDARAHQTECRTQQRDSASWPS